MTDLIKNYVSTTNALPNGDIAGLLQRVYADNIVFSDPAHHVKGLDKLTDYFIKLYKNTNSCDFTIQHSISEQNYYALRWQMQLSHKSLQSGSPIYLDGASFLEYDDNNKIIVHQDYFDLGAMLYENIPLMGRAVRFIKGKL